MKEKNTELPIAQSKVQDKTPDAINQEIERQIEANVGYFKRQGGSAIKERIDSLEREWNVGRAAAGINAVLALAATGLSLAGGKKWRILTAVSGAFMLQQALFGWSPPQALARRMRIRTSNEITLEKQALENLLKQPS
ncbi:MAG TPA: YgaP-like transmembrane domain [Planococcus sp. (in: firmicutes)]|nr:YgaP-like transmembrane domain [Planococcus sp. (in: firmicutes)]